MHTLEIVGELTVQTAAERKADILALLDGHDDLEIALAGVTEMDTAGLQLLFLAKREAEHLGVHVRLHSPSAAVRDVLALIHLSVDLEAVEGPDAVARPAVVPAPRAEVQP